MVVVAGFLRLQGARKTVPWATAYPDLAYVLEDHPGWPVRAPFGLIWFDLRSSIWFDLRSSVLDLV